MPIQNDYDLNKDQIQKFATNPDALASHLDKNTEILANAAPDITMGIHQAVHDSVNFLNSKIPGPKTDFPLQGDYHPSKADMVKFNNYYETVNNPMAILKHVKDGTLHQDHLEAMQAVYPHLLQEMRQKVTDKMSIDKAKVLSNAAKTSLSKFLGQPLENNVLPQTIKANQIALNTPQMGAQQQQRLRMAQMAKSKMAERTETQTQKEKKI